MNDLAKSLNCVVHHQPRVFSLHGADGRVVAFFASSVPSTIANQIGEWTRAFEQGCVCICWLYGWPDRSLGKGDS